MAATRGAYRSNMDTVTERELRINEERRRVRKNDYATSQAGAIDVDIRAWSQKQKLLLQFANWPKGLTDEEAANLARLEKACYWKRCGELRYDGLIGWDRENDQSTLVYSRKGAAGVLRMVSVITQEGRKAINTLKTGN